jgi:hypothetical protein
MGGAASLVMREPTRRKRPPKTIVALAASWNFEVIPCSVQTPLPSQRPSNILSTWCCGPGSLSFAHSFIISSNPGEGLGGSSEAARPAKNAPTARLEARRDADRAMRSDMTGLRGRGRGILPTPPPLRHDPPEAAGR